MEKQEVATVDTSRLPQVAPRISPATIQETMQSISLLQNMVKDLLLRGVDYGRIPGTPQDSLWDPGASQILSAFSCYPGQRRILKLEDSDEKIVVCLEVPIISRSTGQEVGSGIGAASTLETKYKYRWVPDPRQWGYDEEVIKTFKTKRGRDDEGSEAILYRIPNPEHSELLNTIIKMASKRAEVDGAESLPGVSSVLRQIFSGKKFRSDKGEYEGPVWQRFWGEIRRLGLTDQEVHTKLGVTSMKEWLSQGHSLDEALNVFRGKHEPSEESDEGQTLSGEEGRTSEAIDTAWLKEALTKAKWNEKTALSWVKMKFKVEGTNLLEALSGLTPEQKREFEKELNDRVAMA